MVTQGIFHPYFWQKRKLCAVLIACLALMGALVHVNSMSSWWQCPSCFITKSSNPVPRKTDKLILMWLSPFPMSDFGGIDFSGCPVTSCISTADRSLYNESDAVIFAGYRKPKKFIKSFPKIRIQNQYWIYLNMESQTRTANGDLLRFWNGWINLTMSHLEESDIYSGHGLFFRRKSAQRLSDDYYMHLFNRTKSIAWLVSHCETPSKREVYFNELSKHIQVDNYGKCPPTAKCDGNCLEYISKNYKFYFAAENSLCRDYITEKVYKNAMTYDMIPIVYGGANYSKLLPPKSFIDVKDFRSPKELAAYIKVVSNNYTLYKEYFQWREELELFYAAKSGSISKVASCNLCEFLHREPRLHKVYHNLNEFWNDKDCVSTENYLLEILS